MANAVSDMWGAARSGLGALGRGIGNFASGVGDFIGLDGDFGLSGPTGQPASGLPGASSAAMSQNMPALPDFGGGPAASVASWAPPVADQGMSALDMALSTMGADAAGVGGGVNPAGGGEDPGFLSRIFGGGSEGDPLGMVLPGAMLGYTVWRGNQPIDGVENLRDMAEGLRAQAGANSELATQAMQGNLPGPAESAVQQALRDAQTTIRGRYASLGLTGSTPEAQELADAHLRAVALRFQIGQQLAQTGLQALSGQNNLASQLYQAILQAETQQGTALGNALAAFAGATTR